MVVQLSPLSIPEPFPHPSSQTHQHYLSTSPCASSGIWLFYILSRSMIVLGTICKWSQTMFVLSFFPPYRLILLNIFLVFVSMFQHASEYPPRPFLRLNNTHLMHRPHLIIRHLCCLRALVKMDAMKREMEHVHPFT